jgi:hypothetical protein
MLKEALPVWKSIRLLLCNKDFMCILISCSCIMGSFSIYSTLISDIGTLYNINSDDITSIYGYVSITAVFYSLIITLVVNKVKRFQVSFIICSTIGLISQLSLAILLNDESLFNKKLVLVVFLFLGMGNMIAIFAISMDLVCDLTYPVGEAVSDGVMMAAAQTVGIGLV